MSNSKNPVEGCEKSNPPVDPATLITQNNAAMAKMLEMAGAQTCRSGTAIGGIFPLAVGGVTYTEGCEQLAVLAGAMDASQRVFNCAIKSMSSTLDTTSSSENIINVNIGSNNVFTNCTIEVVQTTATRIAVYNELSNDIKESMTNNLEATMAAFLKNMQDDKQTGLFATPSGQKSLQQFSQRLEQLVRNDSYTQVINNVFNKFNNKNLLNITLDDANKITFAANPNNQLQPCIRANQINILEIMASNIVDNAVDLTFNTDIEGTLSAILTNSNKRETTGFIPPDFGVILIIIIVIIVFAVMFSKKPGGEGKPPKPILEGAAAKGFAIFLIVAGIAIIITGIILIIQKKNAFLSYGLLIGGILLTIAGIVMYLKARSQEAVFKQNLEIAQARGGGGPRNPPPNAVPPPPATPPTATT